MAATEQMEQSPTKAERDLAMQRDRLAYLRGQREKYAALDDNSDVYNLSIGNTGVKIETTRREMLAASDQRIAETEEDIYAREHPEKPGKKQITMTSKTGFSREKMSHDRIRMAGSRHTGSPELLVQQSRYMIYKAGHEIRIEAAHDPATQSTRPEARKRCYGRRGRLVYPHEYGPASDLSRLRSGDRAAA